MSTINNYNSTDYSTLFSSLTGSSSSTSGSTSNNILSDYASIKNGSYGKVLKAYYAKQDSSSSESSSTEKDTAKNLNTIQAATSELTKSTDALLANDSKSTAIYNGLKSFVDNYNSVINSAGDSSNSSILRQTVSLVKNTIANEKMLSSVGITINKDNTLSIDESNCKKANINDLTSLFSGSGSFASQVSAKASSIAFYAKNAASGVSTYTSAGLITKASTSSGNLLDDYL
ncbi:MAG: hypothetical protein PHY47_11765 [Lachnospiraceae bacterium]|nr:hypothetical protein [Lachnospiraceae bacterium]